MIWNSNILGQNVTLNKKPIEKSADMGAYTTELQPREKSYLLHPLCLASLALLLLNDHFLKATFHNALTGKLSDIAGLIFFPLVLFALCSWVLPRQVQTTQGMRHLLICIVVVVGLVFSLIQLNATAAEVYTRIMGLLQWGLSGAFLRDQPVFIAGHTPDPGDLIALPAMGLALALGWPKEHQVKRR